MAIITASGTAVCELCADQNLGQLCLNEASSHQLTVGSGGTASLVSATGASATVSSTGSLNITPTASSGTVTYEVCTAGSGGGAVTFVGEATAVNGSITLPAATGTDCFHVLSMTANSSNNGGAAGTNLPGWTIQHEEFTAGEWQPHLVTLTQPASATSSTISLQGSMTGWDGAVVKTFCNVASITSVGSGIGWSGVVDPVSPTGTMTAGAMSVALLAIDGSQTVGSPPPGYTNLISDYAGNGFGGINSAHSSTTVGGPWPDPDNNTNYSVGTIVLNPANTSNPVCETCSVSFTAINCGGNPPTCPLDDVSTHCQGTVFTHQIGLQSGETAVKISGGGTLSSSGLWTIGATAAVGTYTLNYSVSNSFGTTNCSINVSIIDCSGPAECVQLPTQNWCVGEFATISLLPLGESFTLLSATPSGIFLVGGDRFEGTPTTVGSGSISYQVSGSTTVCTLPYVITDCNPPADATSTHFIM